MAVTPRELQKLRQQELEIVDSIEANIDAKLNREYSFSCRIVSFDLETESGCQASKITQKVIDEIIRRYKAAFWNLELNRGDQKQPCLVLTFSA
jgi:hypothetical protein